MEKCSKKYFFRRLLWNMPQFIRFSFSESEELQLQIILTQKRTKGIPVWNEKLGKSDWPTAVRFCFAQRATIMIFCPQLELERWKDEKIIGCSRSWNKIIFVLNDIKNLKGNFNCFFLWLLEKYRVQHVLKMRLYTRLLRPRVFGLWFNSANLWEVFCFQHLLYKILLEMLLRKSIT